MNNQICLYHCVQNDRAISEIKKEGANLLCIWAKSTIPIIFEHVAETICRHLIKKEGASWSCPANTMEENNWESSQFLCFFRPAFFFAGTYLKQNQYLYDGCENTPSAIYLDWLHIFSQYVFLEKVQGRELNAAGQTIFAN